MNQFFQESDKILLNQFSVHRFYLEIIEEMEKIVTSHRQSGYMLDWDQRTAVTFMQTVKYYMNQQPEMFLQTRQKYLHRGNPYYDTDRFSRRSKSKPTMKEDKSSRSLKEESIKITEIKEEDFQDIKTVDELVKMNNQMKEERERSNLGTLKEESEKDAKPAFFEESESFHKESEEEDEDDNDAFYDMAYGKVGSIIFGNFASRGLKRRPKMEDKIYLDLTNCFVKMSSNGRDAFFDRMDIQLFKIDKTDVKL